jgi:DNA-binding SARP family transcriptional activator
VAFTAGTAARGERGNAAAGGGAQASGTAGGTSGQRQQRGSRGHPCRGDLGTASPPPTREDTTRTYVHRLRKSLGPEGKHRILVQPPGYILRVDPAELDFLRFESLTRKGRASFDAGDLPVAASLLAEADALWRGTPLADIPARHLHDHYIRYLEQTRLWAQELRIEAAIRASRHGSATTIPELQVLVTQHPERERLCLLLMLALFRAGRQAEALAAYSAARDLSVADYGVEPGPDLAEMHKRILAQDPLLLAQRLDPSCFA